MVCTPVMHTLLRSACSAVEAKISVPSGKKEIKNLCECDWPNNILLSRKCHLLVLAKGVSQGLFYQPAHRGIINKSYNIPITYVVNWDLCCGPGKHNPLYHVHLSKMPWAGFSFLRIPSKCKKMQMGNAIESIRARRELSADGTGINSRSCPTQVLAVNIRQWLHGFAQSRLWAGASPIRESCRRCLSSWPPVWQEEMWWEAPELG